MSAQLGVDGTLFLGDFHPHLEEAFARRLRELAPDGDARGVTVVVPNAFLAVSLRRRAAELGTPTLGLKVQALGELIRHLAAPTIRDLELKPLEGWEAPFLVDELVRPQLEGAPGPPGPDGEPATTYFGALATKTGLYRALASTFRDLREALVDPEAFADAVRDPGLWPDPAAPGRAESSRKLREVGGLYRAYVEGLHRRRLVDGRRLADLAGERVAGGDGEAGKDGGRAAALTAQGLGRHLLIYGFYDLDGHQRRFLARLLRGRRADVFFPWGASRKAFAYAAPLRAWFEGLGLAPLALYPTSLAAAAAPLDRFRESLFQEPRAEAAAQGADGPSVRLLSVADPAREAVEVVRSLVHRPAASAAVLLRQEDADLQAYAAASRPRDILLHLPSGEPWRRTPAGRALAALLELVQGRRGWSEEGSLWGEEDSESMPRTAVEDLLASGALAVSTFPRPSAPERWPQLLRRLGLVGGIGAWTRLVERHGQEETGPEAGAEDDPGPAPDEPAEGRRERESDDEIEPYLRRELRPLALWAASLLDATERMSRRFSAWSDLVARFSELVEDWLAPGPDRVRLLGALARLEELEGVVRPSFATARQAVERLLDTGRQGTVRGGDAPTVAGLMSLRGATFDRVIVPTLVEKRFPRRSRQDPILLDEERAALQARLAASHHGRGDESPRLPGRLEQAGDEERFLFRLAVGAARRELILVWARNGEEGRPQVPSTYLLEAASTLLGEEADFSILETGGTDASGRVHLPLEIVPLAPGYGPVDAPHLSASEFDLRQVDRALGRGDHALPADALSYLTRVHAGFDSSLHMVRLRLGFEGRHRLTEYDGWVDRELAEAWLAGRSRDGGPPALSASGLETFARCSFHFFHRYVLGLSSEPPPERRLDQDPRTVGSLYHALLKNLFDRLEDEGLVPLTRETLDRAKSWIEPELDDLLRARPSWIGEGPVVFWQTRRRRLLQDLGRLLEIEVEEAAAGWRPERLELGFGFEETAPNVPIQGAAPGHELALRGRIDRLDRGPEGLRVIDYKTGRLKPTEFRPGDLKGGQRLQLALYRRILPELVEAADSGAVTGAYVGVEAVSGYRRHTWSPSAFTSSDRRTDRILGGILSDLHQGNLTQVENGRFCDHYCAFGRICGPQRRRSIEEKSEDSRLTGSWRVEGDPK